MSKMGELFDELCEREDELNLNYAEFDHYMSELELDSSDQDEENNGRNEDGKCY